MVTVNDVMNFVDYTVKKNPKLKLNIKRDLLEQMFRLHGQAGLEGGGVDNVKRGEIRAGFNAKSAEKQKCN